MLNMISAQQGGLSTEYGFNASSTASTFAASLRSRITTPPASESTATAESSTEAQLQKQAQLDKLESSLTGTVNFIAEKHGEKAGTAMMGIMLKSLGDSEITEEALGKAFLDVTRFIDKNFGTDAGDDFLKHLNGNLNNSLNAYFENGLNEQFFAVTTKLGVNGGTVSNSEVSADIFKQFTDSIKQLLEDATKQREEEKATATSGVAGQYGQSAALAESSQNLMGVLVNNII